MGGGPGFGGTQNLNAWNISWVRVDKGIKEEGANIKIWERGREGRTRIKLRLSPGF